MLRLGARLVSHWGRRLGGEDAASKGRGLFTGARGPGHAKGGGRGGGGPRGQGPLFDSDAPFLSQIAGWRTMLPLLVVGWAGFFGVQAVLTGQRTLRAAPATRAAAAAVLDSEEAGEALGAATANELAAAAKLGWWMWGKSSGRTTAVTFDVAGVPGTAPGGATPVATVDARAIDDAGILTFIELTVCVTPSAAPSPPAGKHCFSLVDAANARAHA